MPTAAGCPDGASLGLPGPTPIPAPGAASECGRVALRSLSGTAAVPRGGRLSAAAAAAGPLQVRASRQSLPTWRLGGGPGQLGRDPHRGRRRHGQDARLSLTLQALKAALKAPAARRIPRRLSRKWPRVPLRGNRGAHRCLARCASSESAREGHSGASFQNRSSFGEPPA
jgi:hypothetical protein